MSETKERSVNVRPGYSNLKGAWRADYLVLAGVFNIIIMGLTTSLDGNNDIRMIFSLGLISLMAIRYVIARCRLETSKGWIPYAILQFVGPFVWMVVQ